MHGQHKMHIHYNQEESLVAYGSDAGPVAGSAGLSFGPGEDECYIYIADCLWTTPEAYDDDLLDEFAQTYYDEDTIYVPDDWIGKDEFPEHAVVAILANYTQVRKYLADKAKARGFFSVPRPPKGKGRGRSSSK